MQQALVHKGYVGCGTLTDTTEVVSVKWGRGPLVLMHLFSLLATCALLTRRTNVTLGCVRTRDQLKVDSPIRESLG